ncbi:unnamed protein product [Triticum turgidum subsp. durum]|uniref:Uncharacterized protein n=1 Tax=Triticum turgidum subsp. durum TaxID=4567 RepID=A0A9R1Q3W2_TRITD|nr:unnamed protein product [Triticum turgidum subsp. durum]VAH54270.1 unnamed protein product [Triticum turgidum subsp. durum]VAH54271.1 unnamed protein product [Triticum turgidum subsp. durum]
MAVCGMHALGETKAKPEVKNEEQRSVIEKFPSSVPVIGPAMKGVASVGSHKDEFFSTLQHSWLGLRLLWLDVRISSRLLLKLANGKRLSTRLIQAGPLFGFCRSPILCFSLHQNHCSSG